MGEFRPLWGMTATPASGGPSIRRLKWLQLVINLIFYCSSSRCRVGILAIESLRYCVDKEPEFSGPL